MMDETLDLMFDRLNEMVNDVYMDEPSRYNILDYIEDIRSYIESK